MEDMGVYKMHTAIIADALSEEEPKVENMKGLTNAEWIDFLSEQFAVSRTSAKEMLHVIMSVKKEDNFKKQFSQEKKVLVKVLVKAESEDK